MQKNAITGVEYKGNNQADLLEAKKEGYSDEWITFLQARTLGRTVIKGQKGVRLLKFLSEVDENGKKKGGVMGFTVFNISQTQEV